MMQKFRIIAIWFIPLIAGLILFLLHIDVWFYATVPMAFLVYGWICSDAGDFAGFKSGYQCGLEEGWADASKRWSAVIKPLIGDVSEYRDEYNKIVEKMGEPEDKIADTGSQGSNKSKE
jgi:hypothetical protein